MDYSDSSASEREPADDGYDDDNYDFRQRKRFKQSKDDRMLGIFGDEDDRPARPSKPLRDKAPAFAKEGDSASEDERPTFARAVDDVPAMTTPVAPKFGFYATEAFVPSANPPISTQNAYTQTRRTEAPVKRQPKAKPDKAETKLKSSFGARMMAKMGYKEGTGLGASGDGIVKPIQADLRTAQKAGLGVSAEKDEERPKASKRESQARKQQNIKIRYKTAQEITQESGGLQLPNVMKNLIDLTGRKTIEDGTAMVNQADVSYKLSQNARREAEMYANSWKTLQDRKAYLQAEMERTEAEIDTAAKSNSDMTNILARVQSISLVEKGGTDDETTYSRLVAALVDLQTAFPTAPNLDTIIVATLAPVMRRLFSTWSPLQEPDRFVRELDSLRASLSLNKKRASSFEAFMTILWLPRISASIGKWTIDQSTDILKLLEAWSKITPTVVRQQLIDQLVIPRIAALIKEYSTRRKIAITWVFEWLPYLDDQSAAVIDALKRKLNTSLSQWTVRDGLLADLNDWEELLGHKAVNEALVKHIVPKLAEHLRRHLLIEPADQKLDILRGVLVWTDYLRLDIIQVLVNELFPKWIAVLHGWLLSKDADFNEIADWYTWWTTILPASISTTPEIRNCFTEGLQMMEQVLDNGPSLPALPVGPQRPVSGTSKRDVPTHDEEVDITFKDVVEDFCATHNLLIEPLRKAHAITGAALFRLKGNQGMTAYIQGDLLMLQLDKTRRDEYTATAVTDLPSLLK